MQKLSKEALDAINQLPALEKGDYVRVGMSTCGLAAGAEAVYNVFVEEITKLHLPVRVQKCGCLGMCYAEPLVEVKVAGLPPVRYGKVTPEVAARIVERHLTEKTPVNDYIFEFNYKELRLKKKSDQES